VPALANLLGGAAWRKVLLSLALGLAAGYLAFVIGMPLPWMLGAMLGNTIAALARLPVMGPNGLRVLVVPIIGVMLGSAVSAETFQALGDWSISFLVLGPFLATAAGGSYLVYRHLGGFDPVTAFFSAMPGGLNEMLIIGGEAGGNERRIALAHASRILLTISFVALFFGLVLDVQSGSQNGANWTALGALGLGDYLILAICAALGVPLGRVLRLPAAPMLGPMILSAAAHVSGLVDLPPPTLLVIGAQVVLGAIIGCRFIGAALREVGRDLFLSVFSTAGMLVTGLGFAWVVASLTGTSLAQAFLAYSPGGLTEMSLLALAMGGDIAYVSVTHIVRIVMVIFSAPLFFRWINRG
jgi:uncharacterized protein